MDALLRMLTAAFSTGLRGRSNRRRSALKAIPACDPLEGRRLLSAATARHAAKVAAAAAAAPLPTAGSTTRNENGTTFAADLALLQVDLNALIVDVQADIYYAHALQADVEAIQAEATGTPTPAVKAAFIAQLIASQDGFSTGTQLTAFNSSFAAFLSGEGITDTALIAKTVTDQQALSRTLEIPSSDTLRVLLDRRALANDIGFGAQNYSFITNAGPATKGSKSIATKALKSLVSPAKATASPATSATAKASSAGQAKLAAKNG